MAGMLKLLALAVFGSAIVDAQTAAQRWTQSAGAAQQRYTEGVQGTTKDPTQLAIQQQAKLQNNFVAAVSSGKWSRALARVGAAGWKAATVAKANNYSTGINASQQKYMDAIGPVLQVEAQLQQQLQSMPSATIQDSVNRAAFWINGLHQWALNR